MWYEGRIFNTAINYIMPNNINYPLADKVK